MLDILLYGFCGVFGLLVLALVVDELRNSHTKLYLFPENRKDK